MSIIEWKGEPTLLIMELTSVDNGVHHGVDEWNVTAGKRWFTGSRAFPPGFFVITGVRHLVTDKVVWGGEPLRQSNSQPRAFRSVRQKSPNTVVALVLPPIPILGPGTRPQSSHFSPDST